MSTKYFGIIELVKFSGRCIDQQWFIHFTFDSCYNGEDDCSQHDEDYWAAYFALPSVKTCEKAICEGHFASPSAWNYIRRARYVNLEGLHVGKWMKTSPFHYEGRWQRFPVDKS